MDWRPLTGAIPPITDADWQAELDKYRTSPQYEKINKGISVEEFKGIFWLEYLHRLLARGLGFAFLLPFVYFAAKRAFSKPFAFKLLGIFALGGLQGLVGWLMVKSGLQNDPWVNPAKLSFHLGLAFVIFSLIFWVALSVRNQHKPMPHYIHIPLLYGAAVFISVMVFIQVVLGALVAGNDAGMSYNTFPLMDGKFIPDGLWSLSPALHNFIHNVTMVQYNHRIMAYVLSVAVIAFCIYGVRKQPQFSTLFYAIFACLVAQFLLGVVTLILVVPISFAVLHQANALILFALCIKAVHALKPRVVVIDSAKALSHIHKPSLATS